MKVLVIGAAGFIGKHLCKFLRDRKHEVVGFDLILDEGVERRDWVLQTGGPPCEDADALVHLAAWPYEGASFRDPTRTYRAGLLTLAATCEAAAKYCISKVIYTSTISVYGDGQGWNPPWSETVPPRPRSPYGHAKLAGEHLLTCMANRYGFVSIPLRLGQIYGPGMTLGDRGRAVISIFMAALLRGEPMPLIGDGEQRRSFLYVEDLCQSIERALHQDDWGRGPMNVASSEAVSIRRLASMVAETGGFPEAVCRRPGGVAHDAYLDSGCAEQELGLRSRPLVVGLKQTWDWAKAQPVPAWKSDELPLDGVEERNRGR